MNVEQRIEKLKDVFMLAMLIGCANAPICPEIKVTFCPVK